MIDLGIYKVRGYYPTIGIECHVQLKTKTKLFSSVSNEARGAEPNTLVNHICFGLPGALPVLNVEAVRLSAKAAYALGTTPQKFSKFDRKHYFYPDLPKGYQISQFDEPIILGGSLTILLDNGDSKVVNITRAHMEEDAGKSTHPVGVDYSLVDLNRAGTPLLEIVSEPEMHNSEEAKAFAKELWLRMKYSGVSDVDLYNGNMRFDVNVSVSKDPNILGTRSETKNLNSFKSVERATDYEIKRQIELLENGQSIVQETRGWLDDKQKTVSQRTKEDAHDYRYFPDPDIPPIVLDDEYIADIEKDLPVMPDEWRKKLNIIGISREATEDLLQANVEDDRFSYLDVFSNFEDEPELAKNYANWVLNVFIPKQRETGKLLTSKADMQRLVRALNDLTLSNKISSNSAKAIIDECIDAENVPKNIEEYAQEKSYIQMDGGAELEKIVSKVIQENPKPVEDLINGETKAIGFLVGQVMKKSQGTANPAEAQKIIKHLLNL